MQKQMIKLKSQRRSILSCAVIALVVLLSVFGIPKNAYASDELFVAGIPDAYPLQYYDEQSDSYQGILSDLLQQAANNAGLRIKYLDPSKQDNRLALAKNLQTDIVCAFNFSDEELSANGLSRGAELLTYTSGDTKVSISFAYTTTIPTNSRTLLEQELQKIDKNELLDALMNTIEAGYEQNTTFMIFHRIVPSALILVLLILLVMPFRFRKRKRQIEDITFTDDETGHYNYARWKQKYRQCISGENSRHYAVLYLHAGIEDISHIYGYTEASEAVKIISDVCAKHIDETSEGVARFNEFYFIFFIQYSSDDNLKERIYSLHQALKAEFETRKKRYFLEIHTGVYQLTDANLDLNMVLQYSKVALEYAKAHYINSATYNEFVEKETVSGYIMEHEAIHGLMQEEFVMYLQPIQDIEHGNICGAEALVRWKNPTRGLLKPGEFLDVMKRKNLTGKMNLEIYRQGCRLLQTESSKGHHPSLLFNFSVENFSDEKFADELLAIAQQYHISPKQLIIQLNQPVEICEASLFIVTIKKLREYKFDVCLAGLELDKVFFEYLKYDVNYIKLSKELLQNALDPKGQMVLQSVVKLCHELGLNIICIGVENKEQAHILCALECEMATGFYFYYPVSQDVFSDLLDKPKPLEVNKLK